MAEPVITGQSTSLRPLPHSSIQLERELDQLLQVASEEEFEVGMESEFARNLSDLLASSPLELIRLLRIRLGETRVPVEVLAEAMQWLGEQEQKPIREHVVSLLMFGLDHPSSLVRDAGALALGRLEGSNALVHLERAITKETVPELREDMRGLVDSLQS